MAKLHELLAAEKTPTGAWNALFEDTTKKFKNPTHFFDGHSKSLSMIEESAGNANIEAQAREEKPVTTTVYDTLEYALDIFAKAEDLQYQKNTTNATAKGTVMWRGEAILKDLPVDELLGLEARLTRMIPWTPPPWGPRLAAQDTRDYIVSVKQKHCRANHRALVRQVSTTGALSN